MIHYKGKGEHSVNQLEQIIEQQNEELHQLKTQRTYTKKDLDSAMGQLADEMGLLTSKSDIDEVNKTIKNILKRY